MKNLLVALMAWCVCGGAWASEPGEPLDCSDFVFLLPGYSCIAFQAPVPNMTFFHEQALNMVVDNLGSMITTRHVSFGSGSPGSISAEYYQIEILRLTTGGEEVIGHISTRVVGGFEDQIRQSANASPAHKVNFDVAGGRLLLPFHVYCRGTGCPSSQEYGAGWWIAAIEGFAPMLDVFQSYTVGSSLSLTVPKYPEGMAAADHFDTYAGPLSGPKDFSQAEGLRCNYPTPIPAPGDYLEVVDPLPDPPVGDGYYYATAVTYQGETRYGRKAEGGVLSGRDPAELPACIEPEADAIGELAERREP